jgi:glycosyltransferase involved in cell wall biosynthesis
MSLKINFDVRMIKSSGIGTQVRSYSEILTQEKDCDINLIGNPYIIHEVLPDYKGQITPFTAPIYSIKEQIAYPALEKNSLLHMPHYNAPITRLSKSLVVVHDLIHLQSSQFSKPHYRMYAHFLLSRIADKAKKIVTVSDTTSAELLMRFPKAAGKITRIYNGLNHDLYKPPTAAAIKSFRKKYNLPSDFFLVVGIGKRHKNVDTVIRALSLLWHDKSVKIPLVIGGTGGSVPDYVQQEIVMNGVENFIHLLPYLPESEMPLMYASATVFIMPSLLEGFGFPVIEAMASGTPVLCSSASALPEIAGNAALFFDPKNQHDLREKLMYFLESKSIAEKLVISGIKRAKYFTWKKYYQEMITVYKTCEEA